jgi:hypothetical protein
MLIEEYAKWLGEFDMRELDESHFQTAKDNEWLVVFGHSDDCIELRGCFHDETYYDSNLFNLDKGGLIPLWANIDHEDEEEVERYFKRKNDRRLLKLFVRDNEDFEGENFLWIFDCDCPHYKFKIYDDGDPFCVGIVVDFEKLKRVDY